MLPKDSDDELERLLSGGNAGGRRADALWKRIDGQLPRKKHARMAWWLAPFMLIPTAAVLLLWPAHPTWVARSRADHVELELRASCGQGAVPCRVGQPVFLMVTSGDVEGRVAITLEQAGRWVPVVGSMELPTHAEEPVPMRIVPEQTDLGGLVLEARFVPLNGAEPGTVTLHLEVTP